jgi:cytochrome c peroxidase
MDMKPSLFTLSGYKELYQEAFGEVEDDTLMGWVYSGLAIAAYERTVLATEAPFQQYLNGNKNALSQKEKEGAILFFSKAECYTCHNGPSLANMEFHALGMSRLSGAGVYLTNFENQTANLGRGGYTGNDEDKYKFKVPQLYNLINSKFYGHGSSFTSVEDVIRYKNKAIPENTEVPVSQLANEFHPLNLTKTEIEAISAFIEYGLYDRNLERYVPGSIPSGYCFPNGDYRSSQEFGCQ